MKLEVLNSLDQIRVKDYQKVIKLEEPSEQDVITTLLGIDVAVLRALTSESVTKLSSHISSLFKRQHTLQRFFTLNGKEFGFIPSLDKATYGETDDIESFIASFDTMHKALAVMYRPVTLKKGKRDQYLIEDYEPGKYDELMKDAPLTVALGAQVFFYNLMNDLLNCIPNYMEEEALAAKSKGLLQENGEDIFASIHLLKATFSDMKKQVKKTFTNA